MDTNEQALVQAEAAPLAAPSAAVAGLVAASIAENTKRTYSAALKRLDAALEGQDLTDASLSVYLASLHAAWLAAAGHQDGPLFRRVRRGGHVEGDPGRRLSVNAIRRIIRSRAAAVGIEGRVSGHSLRVGGAQSLAAGGASIVKMQTAGRWQSPAMPGHYARGQLAARGAVARIRYGRG